MESEDRIRALMEENAMLRRRLAGGSSYDAPALRAPSPFLDEFEQEEMEAQLRAQLDGTKPQRPAFQNMPYKGGMYGPGPYMKKMPQRPQAPGTPPSRYLKKL